MYNIYHSNGKIKLMRLYVGHEYLKIMGTGPFVLTNTTHYAPIALFKAAISWADADQA